MKLNRQHRAEIQAAVLNHAFAEREAALKERSAELCRQVYDLMVPEATRKQLFKLAKCPGADLFLNSAGCEDAGAMEVYARGYRIRLFLLADMIVPTGLDRHTPFNVGSIPLEHEALIGDLQQHATAAEELKHERASRSREVFYLLEKISTDSALAEAWPEVMPLAKPILDKRPERAGIKPIAVSFEELNSSLGLPVELAEAA